MRKITKLLASGAILAMLLPGIALAHETTNVSNTGLNLNNGIRIEASGQFDNNHDSDRESSDNNKEDRFHVVDVDHLLNNQAGLEIRRGTVSAVASGSFTLEAKGGKVYTVNTASATFHLPFNGVFNAADLKVNDGVKVKGTINGNVISAVSVVVLPANTIPAKATGTITATSGSTLTMQTKGGNTLTVNTNSNTQVVKSDGTAGTVSDVAVGSQVKTKGLWDMVTGAFTALVIKIKAII